jgi:hypothetical protein
MCVEEELTMCTLALVALCVAAGAADRRGVPAGIFVEPDVGHLRAVSGHAVPRVPSPTGSCPTGWSYSPTGGMCHETHC